MLQNATPLRKSATGPPNISDEHVSCTAPATENASLQILCIDPTPAIVLGYATKPSRFAHFWQGAKSLAPAARNGIWTSKRAPHLSVFYTCDFAMCFAPQRRALFRHLNFQKSSEPIIFFTLLTSEYFEMCFAPQRCAFFRHFNFQKWSEHGVFWCVLDILTWKCASRHNGVHFFNISTSKRGPNMVCFVHFDLEMRFAPQRRATSLITWLHTRRFREPTYFSTLQSHKKLEKHSVSRLSYLFARLHLLSSDSFSFNDSSHLCFSICPYCRKFDF